MVRMRRRTLLAAIAVPAVALFGWMRTARAGNFYYDGPVSDHFDGTRFFLPGFNIDKTPSEVMRWNLTRSPAAWPLAFPSPFADSPPERVGGRGLRVTLIGHASFLVQTGGLNILIDPVYSERASPVSFAGPRRVNPPGIEFDKLPPVDWVLITHNHYDHLDLETLARLEARFQPRFLTPLGNDAILRAGGITGPVEARDWGESVALGDRVRAHLVACRHWSARGLMDRRHALWCAFVLETPAGAHFHIGDTGYHKPIFTGVRERFGRPRLLTMPIGAYEPRWFMRAQHVDPEEAVAAFADCGASEAIGHHWGTFQLTDEPVEAPREALERALAAAGIAADRFRAFRPGQVWQAGGAFSG